MGFIFIQWSLVCDMVLHLNTCIQICKKCMTEPKIYTQ
ncbi:MAG: four-helix bundle copper-binding protein [Alphaproteobacteria bacterium]